MSGRIRFWLPRWWDFLGAYAPSYGGSPFVAGSRTSSGALTPTLSSDATASHINSIFNSAVVPFRHRLCRVFRCDNKAVQMNIFAGFSSDGVNWEIEHEPIKFKAGNTTMIESAYKYDPRVTFIGDRWWITWCNGYHGPTIGIGYTFDFKEFFQCENAFLPFNRNGVLFPEDQRQVCHALAPERQRPHPFGDIWVSYSPDMKFWGEHRHVMSPAPFELSAWQCTKVGAGSVPIRTAEGWLIFFHG